MSRVTSPMSITGCVQRCTDMFSKASQTENVWVRWALIMPSVAFGAMLYFAVATVWTVASLLVFPLTIVWRMIRRGQRLRRQRHLELVAAMSS